MTVQKCRAAVERKDLMAQLHSMFLEKEMVALG
jgi:hypothetical protein